MMGINAQLVAERDKWEGQRRMTGEAWARGRQAVKSAQHYQPLHDNDTEGAQKFSHFESRHGWTCCM